MVEEGAIGLPLVLLPQTTNGAGFSAVRLGVPDDPALLGGTFYAQAFVADPLGPAFGLALSEGRLLVVGD